MLSDIALVILIIAQFLNHFISTVAIESSIFFMGGESGSTGFLHPTNNAIPEPTKPKNWWNKIEFFSWDYSGLDSIFLDFWKQCLVNIIYL